MDSVKPAPQDQPKPRRGGARAGSGRKVQTTDGGPLERITLTLDRTTKDVMRAFGDGEISEGIRRAARVLPIIERDKGK